jgi:hypothetical protein
MATIHNLPHSDEYLLASNLAGYSLLAKKELVLTALLSFLRSHITMV